MTKEPYNYRELEQKWHNLGLKTHTNPDETNASPFICMERPMYTFEKGVHVGHLHTLFISDVYVAYHRMKSNEEVVRTFAVAQKDRNNDRNLRLKDELLTYTMFQNCDVLPDLENAGRNDIVETELQRILQLLIDREILIRYEGHWILKITESREVLCQGFENLFWPEKCIRLQKDYMQNRLQDITFSDKSEIYDWLKDNWPISACNFNGQYHKSGLADVLICGTEHAALFLIYTRFLTRILNHYGNVPFEEPFQKLLLPGMVCSYDRNLKKTCKMGNGATNHILPRNLLLDYGYDALRMFELFMGPADLDIVWDESGIDGAYRYLTRVWNFVITVKDSFINETDDMIMLRNRMIRDVSSRLDSNRFNTAISCLMEYTDKMVKLSKTQGIDKESVKALLVLLSLFAPYLSQELWCDIGENGNVSMQDWPSCDVNLLREEKSQLVVMVNGKKKGILHIAKTASQEEVEKLVESRLKYTISDEINRIIYVPGKMIHYITDHVS